MMVIEEWRDRLGVGKMIKRAKSQKSRWMKIFRLIRIKSHTNKKIDKMYKTLQDQTNSISICLLLPFNWKEKKLKRGKTKRRAEIQRICLVLSSSVCLNTQVNLLQTISSFNTPARETHEDSTKEKIYMKIWRRWRAKTTPTTTD